MKTITKMGAQGDVLFLRVSGPFAGKWEEVSGENVIAHSETGHHHTVSGVGLRLLAGENPMVCHLMLGDEPAQVTHHRPWDTHEALLLDGEPGAVWEVRRQR